MHWVFLKAEGQTETGYRCRWCGCNTKDEIVLFQSIMQSGEGINYIKDNKGDRWSRQNSFYWCMNCVREVMPDKMLQRLYGKHKKHLEAECFIIP